MNSAGNHNTHWSEKDIRKYLDGKLSAREMHELEKAALDDPFLADALEGLATAPSPEADMDQLRSRLDARLEQKDQARVVAWWRTPAFRVAAAAVLIVGIGVATFTLYFTGGKSRLNVDKDVAAQSTPPAQSTQPAQPQPSANSSAAAADSTSIVTDTNAGLYAANEKKAQAKTFLERARDAGRDKESAKYKAESDDYKKDLVSQPTGRAAPKTAQVTDSARIPANDARSAGFLAATETRKPATTPATEERVAEPVDAARAVAPVAVKRDTARYFGDLAKNKDISYDTGQYNSDRMKLAKRTYGNNKPLTFSGRVVDNNNRPLAGALLSVNGYFNVGAKTDNYGNYRFRMRPTDSTQKMTIAMNGYKLASVSLNTNTPGNNVYQLQPSSPQLNEVVVTGFGNKRTETLAAAPLDDNNERLDSIWIRVYPVIGKLAYEQYLDSAKKALRPDSAVHGQERVSFQVDQKGLISEFKIEQSLSPTHDAGVIRMINGGPAWKLLRGKKARALVILNFP
jgi:hypothetical protein